MKATMEWGNKKIEVEGDTIKINACEMDLSEFEEVAAWIDAVSKISCFEE